VMLINEKLILIFFQLPYHFISFFLHQDPIFITLINLHRMGVFYLQIREILFS